MSTGKIRNFAGLTFRVVTLMAFVGGLVVNVGPATAQEATGSITGMVRDVNGVPLESIGVLLGGRTDPGMFLTTQTDASGAYSFLSIPAGDYLLTAVDSEYMAEGGWASQYYGGVQGELLSPSVTVSPGQTTANIDFALEHWGVISGLVVDKQGNPIPNVYLRALATGSPYSEYYGTTQADGTYRMVVSAGDYRVAVIYSTMPDYAQTYFNGTYLYSAAQVVTAVSGVTTPDINLALERAAYISGTVLDANGDPVPDTYVIATGAYEQEIQVGTQVASDGTYRLVGLPPGSYRIMGTTNTPGYFQMFYDGTPYFDQATFVGGVPGQEVTNVNIVLSQLVPTPNDDLATAVEIMSTPYTFSESVAPATTAVDDPWLPCGDAGQATNSVWFRFTAVADGAFQVDTEGSDYPTILGVWTGTQGALINAGCSDSWHTGSGVSELTVPVSSGQSYYIEVAANSDTPLPNATLILNANLKQVAPFTSCSAVTEVPTTECEALEAFYTATGGPGGINTASWLAFDTPCDWQGVACAEGHVIGVELEANGLTGTLPSDVWTNLPYLRFLDVTTNALTGTIPAGLVNLTDLRQLWLSDNQIEGGVPTWLGNLTSLRGLGLNDNRLTGTIPPELGQLANLTFLQLGGNQLTGSIPPELGQLTQLTNLHLGRNQLSGALPPELGNLTNLLWLRLRANQFTGTIPAEFGNLQSLENLALDENLMTGQIPASITNLTNLTYLTLSCGLTSTDPAVIAFLNAKAPGWQAMQCLSTPVGDELGSALEISPVPFSFTGPISLATSAPDDPWFPCGDQGQGANSVWFRYMATADGALQLDTDGSPFTTLLAVWTGVQGALINLGCSESDYTESGIAQLIVPLSAGQSYYVEVASYSSVESPYDILRLNADFKSVEPFTSCAAVTEVPTTECEALSTFYSATGGPGWINTASWLAFDSPCDWQGVMCAEGHVTGLELQTNGLTGMLPSGIWVNLPYLRILDVFANQITGTIPTDLANLPDLRQLWLSYNRIEGSVPTWLGDLTSLRGLGLNDNLLTGTIPSELGQLSQLTYLQLGGNQLTGSIPAELGQLTQLTNLHLGRNQLSGALPPELGNLTNLQWLRLRANKFTGSIPAEFGNLTSLQNLALDENLMTGQIPASIKNLTGLTYLTLSCGLTTTDPTVSAFLDAKAPGWQAEQCLNTPTGTDVSVAPAENVNIEFASVDEPGLTVVQESTDLVTVPGNFQLMGTAYEVTSGATFTEAQVCFGYDDTGLSPAQELAVRLFHLENDVWTDVTDTGYPDTINNQVCGTVSSFSPFAVVMQLNMAPSDVVINGPADPQAIGSSVSVNATFTDPDEGDSHNALWEWGDGSSETIGGYASGDSTSHVYTTPGVYTIMVTITDEAGEFATGTFQFAVIYDPDGGFVTGGGWINSPLGAYAADPSLTGKATFGFVSKYLKGANVPSGNTEFQFKAADFNFKSTSYDWLVVAGAKAQFKGSGTINGTGDYWFMLTATDGQVNGGGDVDKFRIKIWDKATGAVLYDNQMGASNDTLPSTALQGGSIVVHK